MTDKVVKSKRTHKSALGKNPPRRGAAINLHREQERAYQGRVLSNPLRERPDALKWKAFGGRAKGSKSYQALAGSVDERKLYLIDPYEAKIGAKPYYMVRSYTARGYRDLGRFLSLPAAKKAAHDDYAGGSMKANPVAPGFLKRPRRNHPRTALTQRRRAAAGAKPGVRLSKSALSRLARSAKKRARHVFTRNPVARYFVQYQKGDMWVTLAGFPRIEQARDYGRMIQRRHRGKKFRLWWE